MKHPKNEHGFTLIEVIVVVTVLAILLPVIFSILTTIVKEQAKIYRLSEAKQQGDFAIAVVRHIIEDNAEALYGTYDNTTGLSNELCGSTTNPTATTTSGNSFYFGKKNLEGKYFTITNKKETIDLGNGASRQTSQIMFDENDAGGAPPQQITTNDVVITDFELSCLRKSDIAPPVVLLSFSLYFTGDSDTFTLASATAEELAQLHYKTVVRIR